MVRFMSWVIFTYWMNLFAQFCFLFCLFLEYWQGYLLMLLRSPSSLRFLARGISTRLVVCNDFRAFRSDVDCAMLYLIGLEITIGM